MRFANTHNANTHRRELLTCDMCEKGFVTATKLKKHFRTRKDTTFFSGTGNDLGKLKLLNFLVLAYDCPVIFYSVVPLTNGWVERPAVCASKCVLLAYESWPTTALEAPSLKRDSHRQSPEHCCLLYWCAWLPSQLQQQPVYDIQLTKFLESPRAGFMRLMSRTETLSTWPVWSTRPALTLPVPTFPGIVWFIASTLTCG